MSDIGFYRYKTIADTEKGINFFVNSDLVATKTIKPVKTCAGSLILKYLDGSGQYRFYPFNKYYQITDSPSKIGSINKIVSNIQTDQTDKKNIGYNNERIIEASADVSNEELEKLSDIYVSPRVYLYTGNGTNDTESDWIEVIIQAQNSIIKGRRGAENKIDITIILPEYQTIKMI